MLCWDQFVRLNWCLLLFSECNALFFSSCPIKRTKIILTLQLKIFGNYQKHCLGHWIPDLDLDLDLRSWEARTWTWTWTRTVRTWLQVCQSLKRCQHANSVQMIQNKQFPHHSLNENFLHLRSDARRFVENFMLELQMLTKRQKNRWENFRRTKLPRVLESAWNSM